VTWRGPRKPSNPIRNDRQHRTRNRKYWQTMRLPCARCNGVIDYTGPLYLPSGRQNGKYLVVGHIVSVADATRLGWTSQQINALSNSQPECLSCSNRSGAKAGRRAQRTKLNKVKTFADDRARW
jgi:5-methylcytosine-specific restriction endonuclease McrA